MQVLVAGAAGFIGSAVTAELVRRGHRVTAVDSFDSTLYDSETKREKAQILQEFSTVTFLEHDLTSRLPGSVWKNVSVVINLAAVPGLVPSWSNFAAYLNSNLLLTENLAHSAVDHGISHFVQASTSSVYGQSAKGDETTPTDPFSPYGVTKLAAENLIRAYSRNFGLPFTILRYFSVYGPGQRPDMAYHIICERLIANTTIQIFGDGQQSRSNTYLTDCVDATLSAMEAPPNGEVFNIAGGQRLTLLDAITELSLNLNTTPLLEFQEARAGDQQDTEGHYEKANRLLGYEPAVPVSEGLAHQARWHLAGKPAAFLLDRIQP